MLSYSLQMPKRYICMYVCRYVGEGCGYILSLHTIQYNIAWFLRNHSCSKITVRMGFGLSEKWFTDYGFDRDGWMTFLCAGS